MIKSSSFQSPALVIGQKIYGGIRQSFGYIIRIHGEQTPGTVQSIGGVMSTGGSAEFDIVFENGTISTRLPECILRGVQWEIYDEVIDQLSLKRLLNHVKEVDAQREIDKQKAADEYARKKEELRKEFSFLKLVGSDDSARIVATKNIREELKRAFPLVKFSVTSDRFSGGDSIDVRWIDGPTSSQVSEIIDKYSAGHFDGMTDSYRSSNSPFTALFGDAKYVHASRDMSFAFLATVTDQYNREFGVNCTVKSDIHRDGTISAYVSHYENDNGKRISEYSNDTHGERIRRDAYQTPCDQILFSELKAPKGPPKRTVNDKITETLSMYSLEILADLQFTYRDGTARDGYSVKLVQPTKLDCLFTDIEIVLIGKKGAVYGLRHCRTKDGGKSQQMYAINLSQALKFTTCFDGQRFVRMGDTLQTV